MQGCTCAHTRDSLLYKTRCGHFFFQWKERENKDGRTLVLRFFWIKCDEGLLHTISTVSADYVNVYRVSEVVFHSPLWGFWSEATYKDILFS